MSLLPHQFKAFKAFFETLRTDLSSLRETIQKGTTAIANQRITENGSKYKEREQISHAIDELSHQSQERDNTAETSQNRRHGQNLFVQWVLAIATTLAFVAAAIYAWEAHEQLTQMRRATWAAAQTAYLSCLSVQASQHTLQELTQENAIMTESARASVYQAMTATQGGSPRLRIAYPDDPKLRTGEEVTQPVTIDIVGEGTAHHLHVKSRVELIPSGEEPTFTYPRSQITEAQGIAYAKSAFRPMPGTDKSFDAILKNHDGKNHRLTAEEFDGIQTRKLDLVLFTRVTYRDTLGVSHWNTFCYVTNIQPVTLDATRQKCQSYNDTDTNTPLAILPSVSSAVPPERPIVCPAPEIPPK